MVALKIRVFVSVSNVVQLNKRVWVIRESGNSHIFRSSRLEVFCRKGVLRNFAKFIGKHLCQSFFFDKVAGLRSATLLKKRLWHRFFSCDFCEISKNTFFYRTPLVAASVFCNQCYLRC